MGKDWKYILYLLLAAGFYLIVKMSEPREINWSVTYHRSDKNPYGSYVLNQLITDIFPLDGVHPSNLTSYEILDTLKGPSNFMTISTYFAPDQEDVKTLLRFVDQGGNVFIAAQDLQGLFADTLNLESSDYLFDYGADIFNEEDSVPITMKTSTFQEFYYQRKNVYNYFSSYDTARTSVLATNDVDSPVLIRTSWGKGNIYISTTPIAFTNISLLDGNNYEFAEQALSSLPSEQLYWTEFYHLGRMEAQTPLRFVLQTESLRWAYYVAIIGLLMFILFEMKRRQRIIPIIKPLQNTTLEFVGTVGNLYFQSKDHKNIAEKRISFLAEQVRTKHNFNLHHVDEDAIILLSRKTGNSEELVKDLLNMINSIQSRSSISEEELLQFNQKLERFNY